ncbi:MAG: histidinol dehydrogenase [Rhodothermia bacterium]|nr:histidinol dehydrogenase [Rhodothermia bacterium]
MKLYKYPDQSEWSEIVARPARPLHDLQDEVEPIFETVRREGDDAVREFTKRFDGVEIDSIAVSEEQLARASSEVSEALKESIDVAATNIRRFHSELVEAEKVVETMPGIRCWRRSVPIQSVGLYIPGGTAPLFSSVLMLGIPAVIAGCPRTVMTTPPRADGRVHPAVLYAARVSGISEVYRIGGAQAIAALTFGTESIQKVDKIFGPGNQYVTAAKQLAAMNGTAIDMPAGPTEVAIIADKSCDARYTAADVLSQAEHGTDSHILLVSDDEDHVRAVIKEIDTQVQALPRKEIAVEALRHSSAVVVRGTHDAVALVNHYAPEHLIIANRDADELAEQVVNAGSVFVGAMSPEAAGDYATGTNHTLPTNGFARAYSGVSVDSFVKKITFQRLTASGLERIGPTVQHMALAEGLDGHARAVAIRIEDMP